MKEDLEAQHHALQRILAEIEARASPRENSPELHNTSACSTIAEITESSIVQPSHVCSLAALQDGSWRVWRLDSPDSRTGSTSSTTYQLSSRGQ